MRCVVLATVVLALTAAACGNEKPTASPVPAAAPPTVSRAPTPEPDAPYRVVPVEAGGAIAGVCRLVGTPTPAKFHEKAAMGIVEGQDDGSVDLGVARELGGCVVRIESITAGKDWPAPMSAESRLATVAVKRGRYAPHVLLVHAGTQLVFQADADAPDMNVHGFRGVGRSDTKFNFSIGPGVRIETEQTFLSDPGVYEVTEDSRSGYWCWIVVVANPYAELTTAEPRPGRPAGEYRLDDVPAGDYDVVCWHEPMDRSERDIGGRKLTDVLGPSIALRRRVHVDAGSTTTVDFDVPAKAR